MKKFIAALVLGAAALTAPAMAGTPTSLFTNTLLVQITGGPEVRVHFNADHTYAMTLPDGTTINGTWADDTGQLCMTPAGGAAECHPDLGERAVGDTWTATGAQGEMTLTVVAGR